MAIFAPDERLPTSATLALLHLFNLFLGAIPRFHRTYFERSLNHMRQKAKWRITVDFEDGMTLFSQSPFQKEHRVTKNVCHLTHLFYLSQADLCVHRCPVVKINLGFTYDRRHSRGFLSQIRLRPHPKVPDDFQSLEETFEEILLLFLFYLRSRAPRPHPTRVLQERPPSRTMMNKQVDWQRQYQPSSAFLATWWTVTSSESVPEVSLLDIVCLHFFSSSMAPPTFGTQ